MPASEPRIIDIGFDRLDEAAAVLAAAFEDYPLSRYIFDGHGSRYMEVMTATYQMDCLWKLELDWPILGILAGSSLAAVALVLDFSRDPHNPIPPDCPLYEMEDSLNRSFGPQTHARVLEYYAAKEAGKPSSPHLYLEEMGVLRSQRGKGFGGLLLQRINRLSEENPYSTGIGLDTQVPGNLSLYRHFGYQVTSQRMIGPVPNWFMFCPTGKPNSHDAGTPF